MTFKNYRKQKEKKQKELMNKLLQEKIEEIDAVMNEMKKSAKNHNVTELLDDGK